MPISSKPMNLGFSMDFDDDLACSDVRKIRNAVDSGVDVNRTHRSHFISPLMVASQKFDVDTVRHFLAIGANVNQQDKEGLTVINYLMMGVDFQQKGKYEDKFLAIVSEMLRYNPDLTLKNHRGRSMPESIEAETALPKELRDKARHLFEIYLENNSLNTLISADGEESQSFDF